MPGAVDVLVIGAGPAGATIARLLKTWGYAVLMLDGPRFRNTAAESLPPSIHELFEAIGIARQVAAAAFYPDTGSTIWWTGSEARVERHPGPSMGLHVERRQFDAFVLDLAAREGVAIARNTRAPVADLSSGRVEHDGGSTEARFIVDATGRAGLLARQIRRFWDERYRTVALCGAFGRGTAEWDVDPHHTLVEAFESGWAWSVPLSPDLRHVCLMLEPASAKSGPETAFEHALRQTVQFRRLFGACHLEAQPWVRDASLYRSEHYAGPRWILVGDAGSFVDPLSSFGLKKAMRSAWVGAAVVNTCLSHPATAEMAIRFFNQQEEQTYTNHARLAATRFAEAGESFHNPFWERRSEPPDAPLYNAAEIAAAYRHLRGTDRIRFRLAQPVEQRSHPALRGREIVLLRRPLLPALEDVEYVHGISAVTLAQMAPQFSSAGALYTAYTGRHGYTPFATFLSVLSLLVAKNCLEIER